MSRRFALLINPASGGGRSLRALPAVLAELDRLGASHRTVTTQSIEHAAEEAARAGAAGETVAAVGGDGLLRPVAAALKGTPSAVALIPCGRGNDLARVLGIPRDPAAAARMAVQGAERPLDVATVDGTPYLGIASCGFDSDANRIANEARLIKGNLVYLYAALRALATWKPARFTLSLDGRERVVSGYSAGACNNKAYGGGMYAAPDALLDDGRFDVLWVERMSKLRFLTKVLPRLFNGTYVELPEVGMERAASVRIEADRPFAVYADGDHLADLPATVRILPQALDMIAPSGPLVGPPK